MSIQESQEVKYRTDTRIADFQKEYESRLADFQTTVNTALAESDMAYELQSSKEQQVIIPF